MSSPKHYTLKCFPHSLHYTFAASNLFLESCGLTYSLKAGGPSFMARNSPVLYLHTWTLKCSASLHRWNLLSNVKFEWDNCRMKIKYSSTPNIPLPILWSEYPSEYEWVKEWKHTNPGLKKLCVPSTKLLFSTNQCFIAYFHSCSALSLSFSLMIPILSHFSLPHRQGCVFSTIFPFLFSTPYPCVFLHVFLSFSLPSFSPPS